MKPPPLEGAVYQWELLDELDVVLALPGATVAIYEQLHRINRLATPILDFSRDGLPRADYKGSVLHSDALREAFAAVEPIQQRIRALPDVVNGDRNGLAALALAYTRDTHIRAHWSVEAASFVDYPLLFGLPGRRALLEHLAHSGLLGRDYFDRLHVCTVCGSSRLNVREECHACQSSHIVEFSLIHHYRCAHQAAEEHFIESERLVCPKCRRELRHYGVDYDRPGTSFSCRDCGATSPEPEVGFRCVDCDRHTAGDHADTLSWYHYVLMPEAITGVERGLLPTTSLETLLAGHKGACSHQDFVKLASFYGEIASRYDRPLTFAVLTLGNTEAIRAEIGGTGLSRTFALITEVVAQSLRRSDAVTATDQRLYFLLPETREDHLDQVVARIRSGVRESVSVELDMALERIEVADLPARIEGLS